MNNDRQTVLMSKMCDESKDKSWNILKWWGFAVLKDPETWASLYESPNLLVDLKGIDIIDPGALVWLASIFFYRKTKGYVTTISTHLDSDHRVVNRLQSSGFQNLQNILSFELTPMFIQSENKKRKPKKTKLNKILIVSSDEYYPSRNNEIWSIRHDLRKFLRETYTIAPYSQPDVEGILPFTVTLVEIMRNIIDHGGGMGFMSLIPPPLDTSEPFVEYSFSDIGSGFRNTMQNKNTFNDIAFDEDAVVLALLYRRNYPGGTGILGLWPTLQFIAERNGRISVRTGKTYFVLDFRDDSVRTKFKSMRGEASYKELKTLAEISSAPADVIGSHINITLQVPRHWFD